MPQADVAIQFLMVVSSSDEVVRNRPMNNPTSDDIHLYTIQTQIKDTSKVGRDAGTQFRDKYKVMVRTIVVFIGFLQLLILAGAIQHPIQQHCTIPHEFYQLLVPPCSCSSQVLSVANVMWVNFSGNQNRAPNHLIPLIACNGE